MRHVKFWLVSQYKSGDMVSVRGWCEATQDRYEISKIDGKWTCLVVEPNRADDAWGFRQIPSDDNLFACMVAAENDAEAGLAYDGGEE